MDGRCLRTDVVLFGEAPTFSLVDPRSIHIIALVMGEVFLGISSSKQRMCMEETYPTKYQSYSSQR